MRKLNLRKETLAELTNEELGGVVGAAATKDGCLTNAARVCLNSFHCSYDDGCITAMGCYSDTCAG